MTRLAVTLLGLGLLAAPLAAPAQPVTRIGVLDESSAADSSPRIEAFRKGLRELGQIEGQHTKIEWRFAEGRSAMLASLATELAGLKPSILVSSSGEAIAALRAATTTIPIVAAGADPWSQDINPEVLSRPGGNITGIISAERELEPKRMELLRELLPSVSRVATLRDYTLLPYREGRMSKSRSERWGFTFIAIVVGGPDDFTGAFAALIGEQARALSLPNTPLFYTQRRRLADLAIQSRLAWIASAREYADAGCLMSYGANTNDLIRRAATYVDKILKGAKPADLPVEQPSKFELVINMKTAKSLGLTIPQSVLLRADEAIQ
jgi:putative ABC transport system substrate-binding protein